VIGTAARRAFLPFVLIIGAVAGVSAVAALTGTSFDRAVALGLYAVGSFMTIVGFALGSRNLFRPTHHLRSEERDALSHISDTNAASALLIVIGLVLLLAGTAVDPHKRLI